MTYNLTAVGSNATGALGLFQGVNDHILDGMLGLMILLVVSIVAFMAFLASTGDPKRSILASSFIFFTLSLFFRVAGLVSDTLLFSSLVITAILAALALKK